LERRNRLHEVFGARFLLSQRLERVAQVVLRPRSIEGHVLARSLQQGCLVRSDRLGEVHGTTSPPPQFVEHDAQVRLRRRPAQRRALARLLLQGRLIRRMASLRCTVPAFRSPSLESAASRLFWVVAHCIGAFARVISCGAA
jgi:hypothetical protein